MTTLAGVWMYGDMSPLKRAKERYRLAAEEVKAARAEVDAYLSVGAQPPDAERAERALREVLAAQLELVRHSPPERFL
jgi:hypothetical protein